MPFYKHATELSTVSILECNGLPIELPTKLPTISIYGSSGQTYLHGKIPMGSPLSYPLFPYMEGVDSLICLAKFPWATIEQPTPMPTNLPTYLEEVGYPLNCAVFPYMEVVGNINSHGQPTPLPTCSPWETKWATPLLFPYRHPRAARSESENYKIKNPCPQRDSNSRPFDCEATTVTVRPWGLSHYRQYKT